MLRIPTKNALQKFMHLAVPIQVGILLAAVVFMGGGAFASIYLLRDPGTEAEFTLNDGLVGRYPMNGNLNDISSYSRTASSSNVSLTTDRDGNANSAYSITTSNNSWISINNSGPRFITADNAPFSFSLWMNVSSFSFTGSQMTVVGNENYLSSGFRFGFGTDYRIGFWTTQSGGTIDNLSSTTVFSTGTWYNVAITYDGTTARLYVNGNLEDSESGTIKATTKNINIGEGVGGTGYFGGIADDFRMYDRKLEASEVAQIYAGLEEEDVEGDLSDITLNLAKGQKGLKGYWNMNGNAKDATPYGGDGTVNGATLTTDRQGKANKAYAFNGTNNYISVADDTRYEPGTGDFSISAWIKTSSSTSDITIVSKFASSGGSQRYTLGLNTSVGTGGTGKVFFSVGNTLTAGGASLNDGNWHHVVAVRSGGVAYVYADGVQVATVAATANVTGGSSYLGIGKNGSGANNYFNGSIDDVRYYSRGISLDEVKSLYHSYDAVVSLGGNYEDMTPASTNLVGRWQMNGNANDSTPYSNNGTVTGASLTTDRFGSSNSAYSFNGTSNQISIPNPTPNFISSNNAPFTISLWLRPTNLTTSTFRSIIGNETYNVSGFRFGLESWGQVIFWTGESGGNLVTPIGSTTNLSLNTWYHVAVTYDGSVFKLYVNGNPEATSASGRTIKSNTNNLVLAGGTGGVDRFAGGMDDLRLWSRTLTAPEIQAIYQNTY